jgi:hypothetical protein
MLPVYCPRTTGREGSSRLLTPAPQLIFASEIIIIINVRYATNFLCVELGRMRSTGLAGG